MLILGYIALSVMVSFTTLTLVLLGFAFYDEWKDDR